MAKNVVGWYCMFAESYFAVRESVMFDEENNLAQLGRKNINANAKERCSCTESVVVQTQLRHCSSLIYNAFC